MPSGSNAQRRVRPAHVVVLLGCLFALQGVFIRHYGEPYPALVMPGFRGSGGYRGHHIEFYDYRVALVDRAGGSFLFSPRKLFEGVPDSYHGALSTALRPRDGSVPDRSRPGRSLRVWFPGYAAAADSHEEVPASLRTWMELRARRMAPGRNIVRAELRWYRVRIPTDTRTVGAQWTPVGTRVIPLRGGVR